MKRNDFVSNSSSSSFIVINKNNDIKIYDYNNETVSVPCTDGCYQFGWQFEKYDDFWSKLNFCAIQIIELKQSYEYAKEISEKQNKSDYDIGWLKYYGHKILDNNKFDKLTDMLKKVCKEQFNLNIEIQFDAGLMGSSIDAYIDHQSSASEGANMEMFDSENDLIYFLASTKSYIKTGNDNSDAPEGWYDREE